MKREGNIKRMIVDKCRDYEELLKLYESCHNDRLPALKEILNINTYRCFYDELTEQLCGCIYLEDEGGKVMLSGFARRGIFKEIVEAIRFILNLNPQIDIYSRTDKLNARIALRNAGFERCNNDDKELYVRRKVNG